MDTGEGFGDPSQRGTQGTLQSGGGVWGSYRYWMASVLLNELLQVVFGPSSRRRGPRRRSPFTSVSH